MVEVRGRADGDDWICEVDVQHEGRRTHHSVRVTRGDLELWAPATEREDVEKLVVSSFEFLLEREPPDAILASFDLSVIQRYFPDYGSVFGRR